MPLVVTNWVMINFIPPLVDLLSPRQLMYYFKRSQIFKEGSKSKLTQEEANKQVEQNQMNIPKKYADMLMIAMYTAFYIPLFPLGILISIFGIPFTYMIDKVLLTLYL